MKKSTLRSGELSPADVLARVRELDPLNNEFYNKRDDLSGARLFADVFRNVLRFNPDANKWYCYDGTRWTKDPGSLTARSYAKTLARALRIYSAENDDTDFARYALKYGDFGKRETQIKDACDFLPLRTEELDQTPNFFNCRNCVINLQTGERLEHNPELLLSKVSNVVYDPEARCERFESFVAEIMQEDRSRIDYLQKLFGYCLTGTNEQEQCFFCYGSTTRNGKSTLLEVIGHMFGDYGLNAQPETLAQRDRKSNGPSSDVARLNGARFLHMSEPPKRMRLDVALLKTLIGRDKVTARFLNENEFEFVPVFKLLVNTNYLPCVTDDSLFSSGRVKVIPFDRHFEPSEQDPKLKTKLKTQESISGIFNWCLEGLRMYHEQGDTLEPPKAVRDATDEYRESSDKLKLFLKDCTQKEPGAVVTAKRMYETFAAWCSENGYGTESKGNFLDDLRSRNLLQASGTVDGVSAHNVVKGYTLDESILCGNPFK